MSKICRAFLNSAITNLIIKNSNLCIALYSPIFTPWVFDKPKLTVRWVITIANSKDELTFIIFKICLTTSGNYTSIDRSIIVFEGCCWTIELKGNWTISQSFFNLVYSSTRFRRKINCLNICLGFNKLTFNWCFATEVSRLVREILVWSQWTFVCIVETCPNFTPFTVRIILLIIGTSEYLLKGSWNNFWCFKKLWSDLIRYW